MLDTWMRIRWLRCVRCLLGRRGWSRRGRSGERLGARLGRPEGCLWWARLPMSRGMLRRIWMMRRGWPGFLSWRLRWCGGRRPPEAPPHLSVGLARLEAARRGETLFVVAEESAPVPLLERVNDARRVGATILALDGGRPRADALAHEALAVPDSSSFDAGAAPGLPPRGERDGQRWQAPRAARRNGREARACASALADLLDTVSGPQRPRRAARAPPSPATKVKSRGRAPSSGVR